LSFVFSPSNRDPQAPRRGWPPILGLVKSGMLDEEWLTMTMSTTISDLLLRILFLQKEIGRDGVNISTDKEDEGDEVG
ncbi:hypothetical protein LINGRAHAP2_LOCUS8344, partial [Linum grandiflorum]